MLRLKRAKRVRMQLLDAPGVQLPAVEGLLVARRRREYVLAMPRVITEAVVSGGNPTELEARLVEIPRERVVWIERL